MEVRRSPVESLGGIETHSFANNANEWGTLIVSGTRPTRLSTQPRNTDNSFFRFFHDLLDRIGFLASEVRITGVHCRDCCCTHFECRSTEVGDAAS